MLNDPGSSLDLGTFVAYLLPGYIIEGLLFLLWDIGYFFFTGQFYVISADAGAGGLAVAVIILTVFGYVIGLVLDTVAHPLAYRSEMAAKDLAYSTAVTQLQSLVRNEDARTILMANVSGSGGLGTSQRDRFIDAMFYRLASSEVWGRQNWHWAFYEAVRNLELLALPASVVLAFDVTLRILAPTEPKQGPLHLVSMFGVALPVFAIAIAVTVLAVIVTWLGPWRLLRAERDGNCEVYYRHRAWVVLAYLIEQDLTDLNRATPIPRSASTASSKTF